MGKTNNIAGAMTILDVYLGGETPTLIRYSIIFTKREFEATFPEQQEYVTEKIRLIEYSGLADPPSKYLRRINGILRSIVICLLL